jgi:hypothetical protein
LFRKKREPILWAEIAKAELTDDVYEELKIVSQQECKPDYLTIKMWLEGLKRTLTKPETEGIV